jgi:hypothetical protein
VIIFAKLFSHIMGGHTKLAANGVSIGKSTRSQYQKTEFYVTVTKKSGHFVE